MTIHMIPKNVLRFLQTFDLDFETLESSYEVQENKDSLCLSIKWTKMLSSNPLRPENVKETKTNQTSRTNDVPNNDVTEEPNCKSRRKYKSPSQLRHSRHRRIAWKRKRILLQRDASNPRNNVTKDDSENKLSKGRSISYCNKTHSENKLSKSASCVNKTDTDHCTFQGNSYAQVQYANLRSCNTGHESINGKDLLAFLMGNRKDLPKQRMT